MVPNTFTSSFTADNASYFGPPEVILPSASYLHLSTSTTTSSASETSSLHPVAPQTTVAPPPGEYLSNQYTFTNSDYFIGSYLTTIIAVVFKSWWNLFYAGMKLVAPFTELAQPGGTMAENVLNLYYLSSNARSDPMQSSLHGHWLVLWSSVTLLVTGFMAPLGSEVITVDVANGCTSYPGSSNCPPRLAVDQTVARVLQGLLTFTAVMTISLWNMQRRSLTGVWSDPSRISTMASLLHHPEVVRDFQMIDPNASEKEMMMQLRGQRYALDYYKTATDETRYGLVKVLGTDWNPDSTQYGPVQQCQRQRANEQPGARPRSSAFIDFLFALLLLGATGLITAYYKDSSSDGFNHWMSSQGFGPRFLMTLVGSLIDVGWKRIERGMLTLLKRLKLAMKN